MTFGATTVGFVTKSATGAFDELGSAVVTTSTVDVAGCRHRPLNATETPEWLSDIASQIWKTTAPPVAAALSAKSTGQLVVDGTTYEILGGSQPFTDFTANPYKVTILSRIQTA